MTIRNQAENDWLDKTFSSAQSMWIGMNDVATKGTWVWASGEAVTYTTWCVGEPNNAGAGEDYGLLFPSSATNICGGRWFDGTNNKPPTLGLIELSVSDSYTTYRQSCKSSVGMPQLTGAIPKLGKPWTLTVTQLGPNTVGHLFFALDDKFLGINALPLDLASIGAPGCFVNVNTVPRAGTIAAWLPSNKAGVAVATIGIPSDPAVLGFEFYDQFVSLDAPAGRGLRLTTTNAGKAVVDR